jgi:Pentapeptide repeats (8 copies)
VGRVEAGQDGDPSARRANQGRSGASDHESFAKAVEQLSSDKLETRLGGIYTLERISRESEREYWPIMETLTAYVREHAPWPPRQALTNPFVELQGSTAGETASEFAPAEQPANEAEQASSQVRPATDIQAILTVLGRRDEKARKQDEAAKRRLNLTEIDLRGAFLEGAHLEGASLVKARLEGARLVKARLEGASLWMAHLEGASLLDAHLDGAFLEEAQLEGANIVGADLAGAVGLTQARLETAFGNDRTRPPAGLTRPARWSAVRSNAAAG